MLNIPLYYHHYLVLLNIKKKINIYQTQKELKPAIKYDDLLKLQNENETEFNDY
jgi:hypothetical protein